ncbi:substrate-binding periplasmic protein [Aeromonas hydrophila]|uniref:substrate-binding periplasmic protein n=1 Tax=Aeromonas hydrophila TaxID=644 RepID=UPI002B059946|nr:transporter substrate-binding domain-containing protein [Aeromonas hydrophila]
MNIRWIWLCWALWLAPGWAADTLQVVTEDYAPYNYLEEADVKGLGTEVVEAMLEQAGFEYTLDIYPWARAISLARSRPNVLIYSISRFPEREAQFQWIGAIAQINFHVFALAKRDDIKPFSQLSQARAWSIGTVRNDALEQYLIGRKFSNLQRNNNHEANMLKLLMGRIDLWPVSQETANYYVRQAGYEPETLKIVHDIEDFTGGDLYVAASLKTPPEVIKRLQEALATIKQNGIYDGIVKRYR